MLLLRSAFESSWLGNRVDELGITVMPSLEMDKTVSDHQEQTVQMLLFCQEVTAEYHRKL